MGLATSEPLAWGGNWGGEPETATPRSASARDHLSASQFETHDQALPGMSGSEPGTLPAHPWEQTPSQFLNRPDIMVHGRNATVSHGNGYHVSTHDFHAGTEKAAHDRLNMLGPAWEGTEPRFYHGTVDASQMSNRPDWNDFNKDGPVSDHGDNWPDMTERAGKYYKNEWEDPGSVSVILDGRRRRGLSHRTTTDVMTGAERAYTSNDDRPDNFKTWQEHVQEGLQTPGRTVPKHVEAIYNDMGGPKAPTHVYHPEYKNQPTGYHVMLQEKTQEPLETFRGVYGGMADHWQSPSDATSPQILGPVQFSRKNDNKPPF